jgi:MSHA pilin protein MshA
MQHQKQSGFTLIELIIVIVILGILAVTAAPKFIDIQGDATASTLQGARSALQGGSQLIYAKSAIAGKHLNENADDGVTTGSDEVTIGTTRVETEFGFPHANSMDLPMLAGWVDLAATDWTLTVGTADPGTPDLETFGIAPGIVAPDYATDTCHVIYTNSLDANSSPDITAVSGGC